MDALLQLAQRGIGGSGVNWGHLIWVLAVLGFSFISWLVKQAQEQATKKKEQDEVERRELEALRTGRTAAPPGAPLSRSGSTPAPAEPNPRSEVERRVEELRRRREALAQRRSSQSSPVPAQRTPPIPAPAPRPAERPQAPIVFIPGSSGPIVVPRSRTAQPVARKPAPEQPKPQRRAPKPASAAQQPQHLSAPVHTFEAPRTSGGGDPGAPAPTVSASTRAARTKAPRTPAEWRRAIIAREILAPPIASRADDDLPRGLA